MIISYKKEIRLWKADQNKKIITPFCLIKGLYAGDPLNKN